MTESFSDFSISSLKMFSKLASASCGGRHYLSYFGISNRYRVENHLYNSISSCQLIQHNCVRFPPHETRGWPLPLVILKS